MPSSCPLALFTPTHPPAPLQRIASVVAAADPTAGDSDSEDEDGVPKEPEAEATPFAYFM